MKSPFPGMDPYLEAPDLWPDVHTRLMTIFAELLMPTLAPKYVAELETQIAIERFIDDDIVLHGAIPDVTISRMLGPAATGASMAAATVAEPVRLKVPLIYPTRLVTLYIRLREREELVAVIELLSPINKRPGEGREAYLQKRSSFLEAPVHLVEIDLLRSGPRMPFEGAVPPSDYLIMVADRSRRPICDAWPVSVRQRLPAIPIPLVKPDPPVELDLGKALELAYSRARYDLRIDYHAPAAPPLPPDDAAWFAALLVQHEQSQAA